MRAFHWFSVLTILLSIPAAFPQYAQPPVADTHSYNILAATGMEDHYDEEAPVGTTVFITFGNYTQQVRANASVQIAGASVVVDGAICPRHDLSIITARGSKMGALISLPSQGYPNFACNRTWFEHMTNETSWRCDFDHDDCAEFVNRSFVDYGRVNVTFLFRNLSVSEDFDHNVVEVPDGILDAMRNSSGAENLTVFIQGDLLFVYEINNRSSDDCGTNSYRYVNATAELNINRSIPVYGTNVLFFLRSPVLREQWARNNRFDVVVLSQSPLYHADIFLNRDLSRNITLRGFAVEDNEQGLREIVSDYSNLSNVSSPAGWSEHTNASVTPIPLEAAGNPFAYAYEFNYSYSGVGQNMLALAVNTSCAGSARYEDVLLSRMLSYNGVLMENGRPFDASVARPSMAPQEEVLMRIDIGLGLVALVLILSFVNFWLLK